MKRIHFSSARRFLGVCAVGVVLARMAAVSAAEATPSSALDAYRKGDFPSAESQYSRMARDNPADPRYRFNAGAAAYRKNDLTNAATWFESVLGSPDLKLQQQAYYNLGNARFKLGESQTDPEGRRRLWGEALTNFVSAMKLDGSDTNASSNYAFVRQQLEQLERQLPPPQQNQNSQKNQDNRKDQKQKSDSKQQQQQQQQQDQDNSQEQNSPQDGKQDSKSPSPQDQKDASGDPEDKQGKSSKNPAEEDPSRKDSKQDGDSQPGGDQARADSKSGQQKAGGEAGEPGADGKEDGKEGEMTAAQAAKMLETQQGDEKALMFRTYGNGKEAAQRAARVRKPW